MNLLTNYKLLNDTFDSLAETVLINGKPQQAIIGMAYLGTVENRHINSLQPFNRGDYVDYKGHKYLISEEVKSPRQNKYRSTMTSCNVTIEVRDYLGKTKIGEDDFGKPIYEEHYSEPYDVYGSMKQWERSLNDAFSINMMDVSLFIDIQDTPENRTLFAVNNELSILGMTAKVMLQDLSQDGLIGVLFNKTSGVAPY
ncbi:hypothetical protein [Planococcus halotolerans]|uniref:Uncharacterized protein n=1 Tax=Planococcus halotolerans TaxID=2233542 RepID=A0A365KJ81_9BACL|nr:hypothetical protein [Planococcus halotolerans]QHJ71614.1 hypothetical protein DNR44_013680 [Planococcus halotolerans]RAZ72762.1 hypothetical protein DP120_18180 [Planococcus halotolerans]